MTSALQARTVQGSKATPRAYFYACCGCAHWLPYRLVWSIVAFYARLLYAVNMSKNALEPISIPDPLKLSFPLFDTYWRWLYGDDPGTVFKKQISSIA